MGTLDFCDPHGKKDDFDSTPNWKIFFGISYFSRFMQGAADSMMITCNYSLIAQTFKEEKMIYFGYVEAAAAIGLIFGAPLGSLIYSTLGYKYCYYIVSSMFSIPLVLFIIFLPKSIDNSISNKSEIEKKELDPNKLEGDNVNFKNILCNYKIFMAFGKLMISMYCVSFFINNLPLRLHGTYSVDDKYIGSYLLICTGPYLVSNIILPSIVKNVPRRL